MNPLWKKELGREFADIMLRMIWLTCRGDRYAMALEAARYNFMWDVYVEPIYGGYMSPPEPEYHAELIGPKWLKLEHPYC